MINVLQSAILALTWTISLTTMPPEPKTFYSYEREGLQEIQFYEVRSRKESISEKIKRYSDFYNADSLLALNVACAESCTRNEENDIVFNSRAKNPNSTASGVFQFIRGTWESMCEGDVFDADDNVKCAVRILAKENGIRHWEASRKEGFGNGWENKPYEKFKVVN